MHPMVFQLCHALLWVAAIAALLASVWQDLRARIIPNRLVGLVAVCGLGLSVLLRLDQLWISLLAASFLLLGLGMLARLHVLGGGDVKLLSAASLLVPPAQSPALIVYTAVAGGVLSAAYLTARLIVRRRGAADSMTAGGGMSGGRLTWFAHEQARIAADCPVPYALAIAGGMVAVLAGEVQRCLYANLCSF
jgi:prepilin peptidase CpaA